MANLTKDTISIMLVSYYRSPGNDIRIMIVNPS